MPYADLRAFLDDLRLHNLLAQVKVAVDPSWELSGIAHRLMREQGPAALFTQVVGTRMNVATGVLATQGRVALALGLPPDAEERAIRDRWWQVTDRPVKPVLRSSGPCQEVTLLGHDATLDLLPKITWHSGDAAPYFGTLALQVTPHRTTGQLNVGIYRMRQLSATESTVYMPRYQHGGMHLSSWEEAGEPMPMAVVIGADPGFVLAAATKLKQPPDEFELAGCIQQAPLDVVRCVTSDLIVPAGAEIILEGEVLIHRREICGPFGEYTGFYGDPMPAPVFRVRAVTHRLDPIFHATRAGKSPVESTNMWVRTRGYTICQSLREMFPMVVDAVLTPAGISFNIVVSVRAPGVGEVAQLGHALLGGDFGNLKQIVIVDDDIDVYNSGHVEWALATRVNPSSDIRTYERRRGGSLDVSQVPSQRLVGDKIVIDATHADGAVAAWRE